MKKLILTAAFAAATIGLGACGEREGGNAAGNEAEDNVSAMGGAEGNAGEGGATGTGTGNGTASAAGFPKGARIVEENGATWRIDADGTRVRLGDTDSRIVVENGVRYRVDPNGTRVRINDRGIDIDIDTPDLTPDVDVGINKKGNPDIDVKTDGDGNDGPN
jgi:hypothetical protein